MAIKYVCSCGKRLRAPEKHAGRLHVCPGCGESVQIPPLLTSDSERPPMTPQERRRLAQLRDEAPPPAPVAAEESPRKTEVLDRRLMARLARGLKKPTLRPRQRRALETHWYQCLLFPLVEWRLWLGPAIVLLAPFLVAALVLPQAAAFLKEASLASIAVSVTYALIGFLAVGLPCDRFWRALNDAARGEPGLDARGSFPLPLLKSATIWLVCYLAGPIIPALGLLFFGMEAGDLRWFDWVIVGLLFVSTVGSLLMVLGSFAESGLRGLNPVAVIDLTHRLSYRAWILTLVGSAIVVAHGALAVLGMEQLHAQPGVGAIILGVFGLSAMYSGGVLFRLLGHWCHRTRVLSKE
jgi:hypothetical protein